MPSAKLQSYQIYFNNSEEYHHLKTEIFTHDTYYFETDNPAPLIIDAGAHIGLSTLYFKKLYPAARIIAIEPLPQNLALLEKNIWENQLADVTVIPAALSNQVGDQTFYADETDFQWWSTASFKSGAWNGIQKSAALTVPTRPLADFLTEPIDFLKMDIEGAEQLVLEAAQPHLHLIKHMMIEFHPTAGQSLPELVELLEKTGFTTTLWQDQQQVGSLGKRNNRLLLVEAHRERSE